MLCDLYVDRNGGGLENALDIFAIGVGVARHLEEHAFGVLRPRIVLVLPLRFRQGQLEMGMGGGRDGRAGRYI